MVPVAYALCPHQAVDAVLGVGVGTGKVPLQADVVHDLVLSFSRHVGVGQNDLRKGGERGERNNASEGRSEARSRPLHHSMAS